MAGVFARTDTERGVWKAPAGIDATLNGVAELTVRLTDGENGLVVPPEDPQALAAALEKAIRDPVLRKRLGDAAEQRVRTQFDYHSSIAQLTQLFEDEWRKDS